MQEGGRVTGCGGRWGEVEWGGGEVQCDRVCVWGGGRMGGGGGYSVTGCVGGGRVTVWGW